MLKRDMWKKGCKSYIILLAVQALVLLLLLPGCLRRYELVDVLNADEISESAASDMGSGGTICSDRLALPPGVYQIRVWTDLEQGQSMYVQMLYDNANFKSLLNNGVTIPAGMDYEDFEVYVLDKVLSAYVECQFYDASVGSLISLEVWRTNLGSRMLLFLAAVFFVALDALVMLRRRILEGKVSRRRQAVIWGLGAGVLLAYFAYFTDYFSTGADTVFHWSRVAFLAEALKQGQLPPVRVEGTWMWGHGYASPLFYGDFFLYIPALLMLLGFSLMSAYKMFLFGMTAATAVIAYHSFYRCVKDEYAALFGSSIYLLAPYRIYNVHNRGALGECLAMTFLPLVCCGMYLLFTEDVASKEYKKYKWYIVWGMSALLECHLISTEMTAAFMALLCVILWRKTLRRQTFLQLLEAVGIVLLINAWFWVPLLYMLQADVYRLQSVVAEKGQHRGLLFAAFFQMLPNQGSAQTGMWHCEPIHIGAGALMLLVIYGLWRWRKRERAAVCDILALFTVLALVMSTKYFPWDRAAGLPLVGGFVASLQFPSRWTVMAVAFASMFSAFFFGKLRDGDLSRKVLGIVLALTVLTAVYHVNSIAVRSNPVWLYNRENMGTISVVNGEYLLPEVEESELWYHKPVAEEGLLWSDYEKNGTDIRITLENTSDDVRFLELPLTGYKGYAVKPFNEGGESPCLTGDLGGHGDLRLAVPAGYHGTVQVYYAGFYLFHIAELSSLAGLSAIGAWYLYRCLSGKRKKVAAK